MVKQFVDFHGGVTLASCVHMLDEMNGGGCTFRNVLPSTPASTHAADCRLTPPPAATVHVADFGGTPVSATSPPIQQGIGTGPNAKVEFYFESSETVSCRGTRTQERDRKHADPCACSHWCRALMRFPCPPRQLVDPRCNPLDDNNEVDIRFCQNVSLCANRAPVHIARAALCLAHGGPIRFPRVHLA